MKYLFVLILLCIVIAECQAQDSTQRPRPAFTSTEINRIRVNEHYQYKIMATDSTSAVLSYDYKPLPLWLKFDPVKKTLSGRPVKAAQYPIELLVANQYGVSRQKFMLTVFNNKTTSILCLGNSITNGTGKYNSYRRALWQILHTTGYNFDLIGSWSKHSMGAEMPDADFDLDHEGHSGWTFADMLHPPGWDSIRGNIYTWLNLYTPDIVLMELGTNDVFQCRTIAEMLKDLEELVQSLRQKNSQVKVFVAQIPPLGKQWANQKLCGNNKDYDQAIQDLNKAIISFCHMHSQEKSPMIAVDQYSGINTDTEMYDDIHPNEKGEKKMAEKWFGAIHKYLNKFN